MNAEGFHLAIDVAPGRRTYYMGTHVTGSGWRALWQPHRVDEAGVWRSTSDYMPYTVAAFRTQAEAFEELTRIGQPLSSRLTIVDANDVVVAS